MEYLKLNIASEKGKSDFEHVRWHVINYILRQGEVVIRSPVTRERMRPECDKEEFGTVVHNSGFYSYHIDPAQKSKTRKLQIVVGHPDKKKLVSIVNDLRKGTELKIE